MDDTWYNIINEENNHVISSIRSLEVDIREQTQHIKELQVELQHQKETKKALLFLNDVPTRRTRTN